MNFLYSSKQSSRSELVAASCAGEEKRGEPSGTPIHYRPWLFFAIDFAITWIPLWTLVGLYYLLSIAY